MGFSKENITGVLLALLSSLFIGASFIIKKKGLRRAAAASGVRAGEFLLIFIYLNFISIVGFWFSQLGLFLTFDL